MNWRLRFASFFICSAFALLAFWYYRYYISPRPHGVILFVVPGIEPDLISQYKAQNKNGEESLLTSEQASDFAVVDHTALINCGIDPASIMTYFSTGVTGWGNQLGYDPQDNRLDNLLYKAQRAGRLVGIISTESVVAPQVAAFYAHTHNAADREDLARQLFDSTTINSIMGGGAADLNQSTAEKPRDLLKEAALVDYDLIQDQQQLDKLPVWTWRTPWKTRKLLGLFSEGAMPDYVPRQNATGESPCSTPLLRALVRKSIECLQFNLNGYFLVVHDGRIENACRENNYIQALNEIRQLDEAMSVARAYAGENTLILLYAPYAVPGLKQHLVGQPPTGSTVPVPLTKWIGNKKVPVERHYPGPFRPEMEFQPYQGWAAVYYKTPTYLKGFVTPYDLNEMLSAEF
jgi:alkaline phosphatase